MKSLVAPQALDPLAVTSPAISEKQDVDAAIAIAGVAHGEGLELDPQGRLVGDRRAAITLGGAVLGECPTGPAF
jgi:hypothetical protein